MAQQLEETAREAILVEDAALIRMIGAVSRIRDEVGGGPTRDTIPVCPETEDEARRARGDETFEEIRAEGYATSLEEAVAYGVQGRS